MTLLNTSGVLVILTVILLLWFVPRSLRRAPAGPVMEPERPLISAERTAEDILASAGVLLNESEAYQSSDHAVAPGTSLPSSALPQASSSHAIDESSQPAPDTASISQIRDSSPTAPYTDEIPVVEESKPSLLPYFDTSSPSGIALLVAAGLGVLALITGLLALFADLAWGWAVLFLILAGGAWAVSRSGLLESLAHQVKENRDERRAKAEVEDAEGEAYEGTEDDEAYDDAPESVDGPTAEGTDSEATEESEPQSRPATRKPAARKSAGNLNREVARPSRAHIAVEASEDAPEAAAREAVAREEVPAPSQTARPVRPAPARSGATGSAATGSTEPPAAHRQERRQQRPSRFQPIRRGSVLFDQENGSATRASSAAAPRTAGQPRVAQAQVAQPQPVQKAPAPATQQVVPQPTQTAQPVQQAPAQVSAQPVVATAQQPAIHPDQPVARQALCDGSPVRQAPAAPAAQPIPEEIPLPDVLDDSEFDALDIASLNDPAHSTGATTTGGVRATNRHPGAGSSFEAVSNTWNPVQLPKPLSALHRQDQGKNQGKK